MLSVEWLSRYELLENFEIKLGCSVTGTRTRTTGVTAIALLVLRKGELKRRQKLIIESWFSFPQYTWPLSRCIQNLKTLAVIGAENSLTKSFIEEEEKWINKGNDKQQLADSLLHNTTSNTQHLYQISKSSAQ